MGRINNQILGVEGLNVYKFNISEGVVKVNETEILLVYKYNINQTSDVSFERYQ